jgi:tRNA uridine 5-carbamoylmethylation protein Kti12
MLEDLQAKFETERNSKERALELSGQLEAGLDRVKSEYREAVENSESLARQLREADRMREQAIETSRNQQRENANRIIEYFRKKPKKDN